MCDKWLCCGLRLNCPKGLLDYTVVCSHRTMRRTTVLKKWISLRKN